MTTVYEVIVGGKVRFSTLSMDDAEDYKQQILDDEGLDATIKTKELEPHKFVSDVEFDEQ